jgi:hypothetical protein
MAGIIVCCLIALAVVMIPKAMRHRRQLKRNESEKPVQNEEPEVQMIVVPSNKISLEQSMAEYKRQFIANIKDPRNKKTVGIRMKYHKRISQIVEFIGKDEVSIFSYVDNVLKHHFETYHDEIAGHYKNFDDDYLIPRK